MRLKFIEWEKKFFSEETFHVFHIFSYFYCDCGNLINFIVEFEMWWGMGE
jgi:hypothetical protein